MSQAIKAMCDGADNCKEMINMYVRGRVTECM